MKENHKVKKNKKDKGQKVKVSVPKRKTAGAKVKPVIELKKGKGKQNKNRGKTGGKLKNTKVWLVAGGVVIVAVVIGLIFLLTRKPEMTAADLVRDYAEKVDYITDIVEFDDPDGIAGADNEYVSKSSWWDTRLKKADVTDDHAGTLEVFKNTKDAEIREWYLREAKVACGKTLSVKKYGKELSGQICDGLSYKNTYRKKNVLVRLSGAYTDEQVEEYKKGFNEIIKNYADSEVDVPSDDRITEIKKAKKVKIYESAEQVEEGFKSGLDGIASDLDSKIDGMLADISTADLDGLREDLAYVKTVPYFSDRIAGWEEKINQIAASVDEYKTKEAQARKAAKERTFSAGKYTVGKDIDAGTYNIIAVSGSGNCFVRRSSGGYSTVNEMMSSEDKRFYITKYSNAYLGSGYEIEITSSLAVRFELAE